ncbi:MAG: SCO family protein [Acidobacteria bacterium]|nr:MAG: SCO family protein [Acidobacteriota bacterium]
MVGYEIFRRGAMCIVLAVTMCSAVMAQYFTPPETKTTAPPGLEGIGIDQHLNEQVPLNLTFNDEQGKPVKIGEYFHEGRPVILNLVYFQCPMLCTEVLNGLTSALKVIKFVPGKEFEVVTVSFDPRETPQLAANKKEMYLKKLGKPEAAKGWHFLTGEQSQISELAKAVGFRYRFDPKLDQFVHAAGIMLITPTGKIAQYYYGVEYSAKDMRLGIVEASQNRIGSLADQVLLYCYHYDPRTGRYGATITNIVRLGGIVTVIVLGSVLVLLFRKEKQDQGIGTGRV